MKALVFDLDGTLIHSLPDIHAAVAAYLGEEDLPALDMETVGSFIGNGLPRLVERVLGATGMDPARLDAATARVLALYEVENGQRTRPYPGVEACLANFGARGLAMGICTNKPEGPARDILGHLGLLAHFPVVIGGDSLPERKPAAEPLLAAIDRLGATVAETVFVGDSEVDAATAGAAGTRFALYSGGYRKTPVTDLAHDVLFDAFADLPAMLDTLG